MAYIKETGKIFSKSEIISGTTKAGNPWSRQTIILDVEVTPTYTKKLAFSIFKTDHLTEVEKLDIGREVEVAYSVSSRDYVDAKGETRWMTSADMISIKATYTGAGYAQTPAPTPAPATPKPLNYSQEETDPTRHEDLPF